MYMVIFYIESIPQEDEFELLVVLSFMQLYIHNAFLS